MFVIWHSTFDIQHLCLFGKTSVGEMTQIRCNNPEKNDPKLKVQPPGSDFPLANFPSKSRPYPRPFKTPLSADQSRVWKRIDFQNDANRQTQPTQSTNKEQTTTTSKERKKRSDRRRVEIDSSGEFSLQHQNFPRSTFSGGARRLATRSRNKSQRVGGGWSVRQRVLKLVAARREMRKIAVPNLERLARRRSLLIFLCKAFKIINS